MASEDNILNLHTEPSGLLWQARGRIAPESLCMTLQDAGPKGFGRLLGSDLTARVLGTQDNVGLILALYAAAKHGNLGRLEVASPAICTTEQRRQTDLTLYQMRQCHLPASLGGWHVFSEVDYCTYALAAGFNLGVPSADEQLDLLRQHPLWHDLSFLSDLHLPSCARLIAEILDPRWYIRPSKPDRGSRLMSFLGLNPKMQYEIGLPTTKYVTAYHRRCKLVRSCWFDGAKPEMDSPGRLLWRVWGSHGGGYKGELRASQKFITFVRYAWLSGMCQRSAGVTGSLFDETAFFTRPQELQAYREHTKQRTA